MRLEITVEIIIDGLLAYGVKSLVIDKEFIDCYLNFVNLKL